MNAYKLIRETLRAKLLAGGKPGEYVLNVSAAGVKVAPAQEYNLAMLAGMKDFWQLAPMFDGTEDCLAAFERNADLGDGECRVTAIFDGHSNTFTTQTVNVVPVNYVCTVATTKEVGNAVRKAKEQAAGGNRKGHDVKGRVVHGDDYSISKDEAEDLKRELFSNGHILSYTFMKAALKLIEQATNIHTTSERQQGNE